MKQAKELTGKEITKKEISCVAGGVEVSSLGGSFFSTQGEAIIVVLPGSVEGGATLNAEVDY